MVEDAAARAGREISPEHFGASIAYVRGEATPAQLAQIAERAKGRDPALIVPVGLPALHELLERFIDVGFSKFVVRPIADVVSWHDELSELAGAVGSLQS